MRVAGRVAAQALELCGAMVRPGVTTDAIDRAGHEFLLDHGAYPSTLGYRGFPKSMCTSVNEVICHGIPDDRELQDGDICNIDVTAYVGGVHGDNNATFLAGEVAEETRLLVERAREALMRGIRAARPGREINVIGRVIESYARRFGYGVVRDFTGHGIGRSFHSPLIIPHYDAAPSYDTVIEPGMTFTVGPCQPRTASWEMLTTTGPSDRGPPAFGRSSTHHLITDTGNEILTSPDPRTRSPHEQEDRLPRASTSAGRDQGGHGRLDKGGFAASASASPPGEVHARAVADIIDEIVDHFDDVRGDSPIGVTIPGVVTRGVVRSAANIDRSWLDFEAETLLEKKLGHDIILVNDADAAGVAELHYGAAKGQKGLVILTTLGTGIGTALIHDGVLIPNSELGHLELDGFDAEKRAAHQSRTSRS